MLWALSLCRFVHFGAAILLWGGVAAHGGMRRARGPLWGLLAISGTAWLLLQTGIAGGDWSSAIDPGTVALLLGATEFGTAWAIHLGAIALLGAALWTGRGVAVAAALSLATLALSGHAVMHDGWLGIAHRANDALHLLAGGYWLGALPCIAAQLRRPAITPQDNARLIRFSRCGHWAVALVIATGAVNTALVLGHVPDDPTSPYQLLLAIKIGLVGAMVLLAVVNQYVLVPRMERTGTGALRRNALAEVALGTAALALVSVMVPFAPT